MQNVWLDTDLSFASHAALTIGSPLTLNVLAGRTLTLVRSYLCNCVPTRFAPRLLISIACSEPTRLPSRLNAASQTDTGIVGTGLKGLLVVGAATGASRFLTKVLRSDFRFFVVFAGAPANLVFANTAGQSCALTGAYILLQVCNSLS